MVQRRWCRHHYTIVKQGINFHAVQDIGIGHLLMPLALDSRKDVPFPVTPVQVRYLITYIDHCQPMRVCIIGLATLASINYYGWSLKKRAFI
jgi:hypothetical protein